MKSQSTTILVSLTLSVPFFLLAGCDKPAAPAPTTTGAPKPAADHTHADGAHDDHHDEKLIALGTSKAGSFDVTASRGEGQLMAGKDTPIDATITPAAGAATTKLTAVRFWIGSEDAKGSIKAKADLEDPKNPNLYHAHTEIPSPLPAGSKLWIELEDDKGQKSTTSFDLKM